MSIWDVKTGRLTEESCDYVRSQARRVVRSILVEFERVDFLLTVDMTKRMPSLALGRPASRVPALTSTSFLSLSPPDRDRKEARTFL
jgi:hypothetical protein